MPDQAAPPSPKAGGAGAPVVAFDALGAEGGADVAIEGIGRAAADGISVRAFGRPDELGDLGPLSGVEVVEAPALIPNDVEPAAAVRARSDASIVRAAADVAEGRSDALASPGSTGATMAAAVFALKRLRAVQRPALAVQLPSPTGGKPTLMLDVGANADNRASHLVQFAYLGSAFSEAVLGRELPRIGLLSVGEEGKKGSSLVVEAHEALADSEGINFIGNVEGQQLLGGSVADVIVADGFTGNVALKTIEGTAKAVAEAVREAAGSSPKAGLGGLLLKGALGGLRGRLDPDQTGGAILLGLRGVAVVGHGSAGPEGIANQIRLAAQAVSEEAVVRTAQLLEDSGAGRGALRERSGG